VAGTVFEYKPKCTKKINDPDWNGWKKRRVIYESWSEAMKAKFK
jgi:hypothetical protein